MENMVKEYRILTKKEEELIDSIVEKSNLILKSANSIVNKINIIMDKLEIIIGEDMKMRSNISNITGQSQLNGQNTQYFSFDSTITSIDNLNKRLDTMITHSQSTVSDVNDNKNDEKIIND